MKAKLRSPKGIVALAAAGGLVVLAAGWFLLVSPQRSKAAELDARIASVQSEIAVRRAALAAKPNVRVSARASDLYRLTKAIPDRTDMAGILLELNRLAGSSGVTIISLTPAQAVLGQGYNVQPIALVVEGRYGQVSVFLKKLRRTVTVRRGYLASHGRLLSVDGVEFTQGGERELPLLRATVTVDAFVYAGGSAPGGTSTTQTSSTPPGGAVAAGATP